MEIFTIIYNGQPIIVRVDHEYHSTTHEPIYFIDLPQGTVYIEMGDDGYWTECEGEPSEEIQALGELIEEQDL